MKKSIPREGTYYVGNKCVFCGSLRTYCENYDVYYCKKCDKWLEDRCNDPDCRYCACREDKPSIWKGLNDG